MNFTVIECPTNMRDIKCPYSMKPTRVVVHNTANDASAYNEISYMHRNDEYVSFHYAVDDLGVIQGISTDRNAWHAGDGAEGIGNREGIGIEICYSKSGGEKFYKAEQNAAEFIAKILIERGWGIDRVTKHQDYSDKYCPHRTLDMGWERFLKMVEKAMVKELTTVNDIVWELNHRGIMTDKALWLKKLETDKNAYWLARKCCHYIRTQEVKSEKVD